MEYQNVCTYFPEKIKRELLRALLSSKEKPVEIHIVLGSGSSVRFLSGRIYMGITVTENDISEILSLITGRALYAHRHTIKEGYVSLDGGIRVGICGQARYERGELVGVSGVTSLLIRIPSYDCSFADKLSLAFGQTERGMMIFAPASGGKTTALRALIKKIASSENPPRISVIDERCEFDIQDFLKLDVDVFRGYERGEGMRIALRVMSPEIIAIDEIGRGAEVSEMLESLFSGVRFIATAHAVTLEDLKKRKNLKELFDAKIFDTFVRIFNTDGVFGCEILKEE